MRAGRNWARIVLTVLTALSIGNTLRPAASSIQVGDITYSVGAAQVAGWIGDALGVIAIILMFMSASNAYVNAVKARRSTV